MLVELAVGDACGAGFEYVWNRKFVSAHNDLSAYVRHPWHKQKPGTYTDDTQMSIAIAELVVEGDTQKYSDRKKGCSVGGLGVTIIAIVYWQ